MTVDVTYQLSGRLRTNLSSAYIDILSGTATVRYHQATGNQTSWIRPARFLDFDAAVRGRFTLYGGWTHWQADFDVTGGIQALGSLTAPGGMLHLPLFAAGVGLGNLFQCDPSGCAVRPHTAPVTLNFIFSESGVTPLAHTVTDVRNVGDARFGLFDFWALPSDLNRGSLTMREVSRTVVPEPSTGVLLSVGLVAGLAVLIRRR